MNKKGFTLIELLAVIVVLAIVMVLAVTTVLPYMGQARKDAFATEAEAAKSAAANAVSLIMLGNKLTENTDYKVISGGYCFTIDQLVAAGLLETETGKYDGVVKATSTNDKAYTYEAHISDGASYVMKSGAEVKGEDVVESNSTPSGFLTSCS